ncbi:MAG TPA: acyl-CoA dehydrogenase [Gemmatimonas aurantiaca]|uniref:3-methylmercaptopropionyl-CoA dehydrogenase n=2 Tax=Gemmatimonas aurantiaca TaxID=173480 RepID=C1A9Y9_GEMAT|nr:acyl-CoA dehydrogenase C-terminal domain-containing protein [Gemmatimonas aurantiaca]BAH39587.1 putative acyl-CoA dehydrogenase [Gemmatimonas aurantiaca T-27]HCT58403.1 acyl-CoA dehydrogenase [Gemmatimonas aurantiaca]
MPAYKAPLDDIRFLLHDVHDIGQLAALPGFEDATPEMIDEVLAGGATFCEEVLFPINQSGDAEGVHFDRGEVRTPAGFKEAYARYAADGWTAVAADANYGGQGLPEMTRFVMEELLCSANLSFSMYPGLSHGAYSALISHGSEELKQRFLPKLIDGSWGGTMCLTEAHAGTDLGIITTKAVPAADGTYAITGQKIFISAGEHDLTENIVHLVLARLPDAPSGTKGISLFLVPKFLPTADGGVGARNAVTCGSVEHKMGIKASATCVLDFDNATGWMVGEAHKGMRAMFVMMNSARLAVGLQGLGLSEVAYQNALAYAKERLQGRSLTGPKNAGGVADPILVHPDVRKGLLRIKALNEGMRSLAYAVGIRIDLEHRHPDAAVRQDAEDMVQLMTPVIKAFLTDKGFDNTNIALQTLGGHGYIKEYGIEQYVRDARIAQIYEGTNAVQALDLVGRKLPMEGGRLVRRFFELVKADVDAAASVDGLEDAAKALGGSLYQLQKATMLLAERGFANPDEAGAAATEYLHLMGYVAVGWQWLRMATVAGAKLAAGTGDRRFLEAKLKTARFYFARVLPETGTLLAAIQSGAAPIMAFDAAEF